jgi:hypothetical protein
MLTLGAQEHRENARMLAQLLLDAFPWSEYGGEDFWSEFYDKLQEIAKGEKR